MLKANLHAHTNYIEKYEAEFSPRELIDLASRQNFKVFSITEHSYRFLNISKFVNPLKTYNHIKDYAKQKNILLIPGAELLIEKKEVLLHNYLGDLSKIKTFEDLEKIKNENVMIMAPHPFYGIPIMKKESLGKSLKKHKNLFDAIEHSNYYTKYRNKNNKKAIKFSKKHKIPIIANSDAHFKFQLHKNFSLLNCEKNTDAVMEAVRKNKFKNYSKPLTACEYLKIPLKLISPIRMYKAMKLYKQPNYYG